MFLSKAVAVAAQARGHEVIVAARGKSGRPPEGVRFVTLDRENPEFSALDGETFDAVVDVARIPAQITPVLDALADRVGHWTFVSTISVYSDVETVGGTADTTALLEPAAADSTDPSVEAYGASKVTCENLVRDRLGDKAFIPRPGLIVGPGDPSYRFGYWPDRLHDAGEVLAPGAPDRGVQWIDVRDHAEWIVHAAENQVVGTFDTVTEPMPFERFLHEIARAMGTEPTLTWVSEDFVTEHGVNPWAGPDSIGLWLPADHAGMLTRDVSTALEAGLKTRPVGESARDWFDSMDGAERDDAKRLGRAKEAEILAAWHAR